VSDLDTPVVTADLTVLERNIKQMAEYCRDLDIALRAHTKTHKVPEIARMQVAAGANGICCQKLGEAEVMVAGGLKNILVPYNIVGKQKLERLTRLTRRAEITVAVDSEVVAKGISDQATEDDCEVDVIIELDTGLGRCGCQSPAAAADLAQKILRMPRLNLQGVMIYPSTESARPFLQETLRLMKEIGAPMNIISGGGTGNEAVSKSLGCTETRSGSYAFEGPKRIGVNNLPNPQTCVLRIISTVVSTPTPNRVIIDAGWKTFTSHVRDPSAPMGVLAEYPEAKIMRVSVEHGHVDVSACSRKFTVGERVSVIPMHQEMSLNLHEELVGCRNGKVEVVWRVEGRGKVR